jgi:hypothetical protein
VGAILSLDLQNAEADGLGVPMDTVWFGVRLGIGIVTGMTLIRSAWCEITGFALSRQFTRRGCTYENEGGSETHPNGWMTRDPNSGDWILWDVDRQRTMRLDDEAPRFAPWKASTENLAEFLSLAEGYNKWLESLSKPTKQTSTQP